MPWKITKDSRCPASKPYGVVGGSTGNRLAGCHPTQEAAKKQLAALYVHESKGQDMWQEWNDEHGRCYVNTPYVIRQFGGRWRLDGGGLCIDGTDPDVLKITAESHQARYQRVAVGVGAPSLPDAPPVNPDEYRSELHELRVAAKRLRRIADAVKPYEVPDIAGSRAALEGVRDELQQIIERLP
jgi:hypothetical protein